MGIEAAAGGGDEVDWWSVFLSRIGRLEGGDAIFHRGFQGGVRGAEVGAARRAGVVRLGRGGGGSAPEVFGVVELLADQPAADRLAIFDNQAAGRLTGKYRNSHTRNG